MDYEEYREIDLKELLYYVLRRWKKIIAVGLIIALLMGAYKAYSEYKTSIDPEKEGEYWVGLQEYKDQLNMYENLVVQTEDKIDTCQEYIDRSVMMKADYQAVYIAKASYYVDSGYQILPSNSYQDVDKTKTLSWYYCNHMKDYSVYEKLSQKTGMEIEHLIELISIANPTNDTISLTVYHTDEASARTILTVLQEQMSDIYKQLDKTVKDHSLELMQDSCGVYVQEWLKDKQQAVYDEILTYQQELIDYKKELHNLEKNPPSELSPLTSFIKGLVLGGIVGVFLMVGVYVLLAAVSTRTYAPGEFGRKYKVPMLGMVCLENKKLDKISGFLRKLERRLGENSEENYSYLAENLANRCSDAKSIVFCSDMSLAGEELTDIIRSKLPQFDIKWAGNPAKETSALRLLAGCEQVILVVVSEKSRMAEIGKIMSLAEDYKKPVSAYVFAE